jgi:hypothetical protein
MIVKGKVKNKDGSGEFGAKVYVSDSQSVITPKKIGTTTDTNGDFQLDISQKDGTYLTAKSISGAITKTPIIEGVSDYLLDLSLSKVTTIPEVKVTANKTAQQPINSAKNETKNETKKRSKFDWVLFGFAGLGALLLIVGGVYVISKKNK